MKKTSLKRRTPLKARKAFKPKGSTSIERMLGEGLLKRASSISKKPRKPMKKRAKGPTGELKLFLRLYEERGGISEISGIPLLPPDHDRFVSQFSHILPKGSYPELRLEEMNIVLKTVHEHDLWETRKWELRDKPEWRWVFELEERLKQAANA